ncbi:MAG: polysaccharide pyruvyl transferase family protein [Lachnospiraceae bacterium]|nr:polysaccharide pyruvyl transferase family protein [Lachnospiraceae bacterium]
MKRVLLLAYLNQNLGDDLFIYTICKMFPNTRFYLFSSIDYKKRNTIRNLHVYAAKWKIIDKIRRMYLKKKSDAIVFVGGSLFGELAPQRIKVTEESVHDRLMSLSCRMYNENTPFFLLGCNFGPYITENFRLLHEKTFEKFHDVCFRDKYSYTLFTNNKNSRYAPDIVFNLYGHFSEGKRRYVLISVWGWMEPGNGANNDSRNQYYKNYYRPYREKMIEIVKYYCMKGKDICLMSFCGAEGDELACRRIVKALTNTERERVKIFSYRGNMEKAIRCLENAEMIIATRFHSMILGWLMGKVVFPISYECKTENVIKDIGFEGNYVVMEQIEQLKMEDIEYNYKNQIVPDISQIAEQSKEQFSVLKHYIT